MLNHATNIPENHVIGSVACPSTPTVFVVPEQKKLNTTVFPEFIFINPGPLTVTMPPTAHVAGFNSKIVTVLLVADITIFILLATPMVLAVIPAEKKYRPETGA